MKIYKYMLSTSYSPRSQIPSRVPCMKLGPGTFIVLPRNYPFRGPTLRANPAHRPTLQTSRL